MNALQVCVALFLLLETANVLALYFRPGSRRFNAVGVFDGWESSRSDPGLHDFVRYLVNWVAGTKLIFIALWLIILLTGAPRTQFWASVVMVPAIATYYWRLHPIVRDLDGRGLIHPPGYSRMLAVMIGAFMGVFVVALLLSR